MNTDGPAAILPFPAPRRRPGPRTLAEQVAELGEGAPWLVLFRRGLALKAARYDLTRREIAERHLGVSAAQFRRWGVAYAALVRAGEIVESGAA